MNDTPRRIGNDRYHEIFEISLDVNGYDRSVVHTVADIGHDGTITLTRTNNGYTMAGDDGAGWKPYIETERFGLSAEQMKALIEAWQTVLAEEESRQAEREKRIELPF